MVIELLFILIIFTNIIYILLFKIVVFIINIFAHIHLNCTPKIVIFIINIFAHIHLTFHQLIFIFIIMIMIIILISIIMMTTMALFQILTTSNLLALNIGSSAMFITNIWTTSIPLHQCPIILLSPFLQILFLLSMANLHHWILFLTFLLQLILQYLIEILISRFNRNIIKVYHTTVSSIIIIHVSIHIVLLILIILLFFDLIITHHFNTFIIKTTFTRINNHVFRIFGIVYLIGWIHTREIESVIF